MGKRKQARTDRFLFSLYEFVWRCHSVPKIQAISNRTRA
jgi:hypothetical protein